MKHRIYVCPYVADIPLTMNRWHKMIQRVARWWALERKIEEFTNV